MSTTTPQNNTPEFTPELSIPQARRYELLRAERRVYGVIPFEVDTEEVQNRAVEAPAAVAQPEPAEFATPDVPTEPDPTIRMLDVEEVRKVVAQINA